tara:strand:- start:116 stop:385 length:270 start_codon:yes stop_codon:yes gene_type:complete
MWRKKMKERIKKIVRLSLQKNNWGIYFKGKPLMEMPVNGEASIYKLNEVTISELEGAISEEVDSILHELNNQGDTECQNETTSRSSDVS